MRIINLLRQLKSNFRKELKQIVELDPDTKDILKNKAFYND